jgi:APA family basic amino acid/polyamine antiporter
VTTGFVVFLNYRGIRLSARFQNLVTFGLLALFCIFSFMGLAHGSVEHLRPFFSRGAENGWAAGLVSVVMVLQVVPFFLTGFESVPKCSEEARDGFNPIGFSRAIFLGLAAGTVFYVVIIGVVSGLVPWRALTTERFATLVAFKRAFGSDLIVRVIILAALLSLLNLQGRIAMSEPNLQLRNVPPGSYVLSFPSVSVSATFTVQEGAPPLVQLP